MNMKLTFWGKLFAFFILSGGTCILIAWPIIAIRMIKAYNARAALLEDVHRTSPGTYARLNKNPTLSFEKPCNGVFDKNFQSFIRSDELNDIPSIKEKKEKFAELYSRLWKLLKPVLITLIFIALAVLLELYLVRIDMVSFTL